MNFGLQFKAAESEFAGIGPDDLQDTEELEDGDAPPNSEDGDSDGEQKTGEVVALDAFRKKKT